MSAPDRLVVPQAALEAMVAHARAEAPRECCGLLIGLGDRVERAAPARNTHASATRYLIDPADHFAALRQARAGGLAVIGAYHSHPHSPPRPSETDLAEANDPTLIYVIVSLDGGRGAGPEARAYRFIGSAFEAVPILPVRDGPT